VLRVVFQKLMRLFVTLAVLSVLVFATIVAANEMNIFHRWSVIGEVDWDVVNVLKTRYGLEEPVYVQYFLWARGWIQGDWGQSLLWNKPVADVVAPMLGRTLAIFAPLVVVFCSLALAVWMRPGPRCRRDKGWGAQLLICLRAIPMFLWVLALFFVAGMIFGFDPRRSFFVFVEEGLVWDSPHLLNFLTLFSIPMLVIGAAILVESLIVRLRWFESARDDLAAYDAKKLSGKDARKAWRRLFLPQFVGAFRDSLPGFVSEITLLSIVVYWPTLGPTFVFALTGGDPRLSAAILFVIAGGVAVGCFLLDVWAAWLERAAFKSQSQAVAPAIP